MKPVSWDEAFSAINKAIDGKKIAAIAGDLVSVEAMFAKKLIGCAQTGTGKTAAFVLPTLNQLSETPSDGVQVLILCPTRELAIQIDQEIQGIAYFTNASCFAVYGGGDGVSWEAEADALKGGADVIVATPGRLLDLFKQGKIKFKDSK